jgi:peptide chain release factor subunit 1
MDILREKETFGIILIDSNDATLATLRGGRRMEIMKEMTSGVPGKHRAGGQSARRFERIRDAAVNEYFKRVGNYSDNIFGQMKDLKGIIIGGPGPTKHNFEEGDYLNYMIKDKIVATIDTSYVGANGIKEIISKSGEILRGVRYSEEKKLVQKFLYELGHETGKASYGENEVRGYLKEGLVDILLLSEKLDITHVKIKCTNCEYMEDRLTDPRDLIGLEKQISQNQCPKCLNQNLIVDTTKDLTDELVDEAERSGTETQVISADTDEGVMLKDSFGGIAAILRYGKK